MSIRRSHQHDRALKRGRPTVEKAFVRCGGERAGLLYWLSRNDRQDSVRQIHSSVKDRLMSHGKARALLGGCFGMGLRSNRGELIMETSTRTRCPLRTTWLVGPRSSEVLSGTAGTLRTTDSHTGESPHSDLRQVVSTKAQNISGRSLCNRGHYRCGGFDRDKALRLREV